MPEPFDVVLRSAPVAEFTVLTCAFATAPPVGVENGTCDLPGFNLAPNQERCGENGEEVDR